VNLKLFERRYSLQKADEILDRDYPGMNGEVIKSIPGPGQKTHERNEGKWCCITKSDGYFPQSRKSEELKGGSDAVTCVIRDME
jgi:hypothetical protein